MICELAKQYSVENLRFTLKETPLRTCGFICYTTSSDELPPGLNYRSEVTVGVRRA